MMTPTAQATDILTLLWGHATSERKGGHAFFNPRLRSFDWVPYGTLAREAFAYGKYLLSEGVRAQDLCLLVCQSPRLQLTGLYGAISIGAIPMVLPGPKALGGEQHLVQRICHWYGQFAGRAALVLEVNADGALPITAVEALATMHRVALSEELIARLGWEESPARMDRPSPSDVAYLQTTSASTSSGKATAIAHGNVLANVEAIRIATGSGADERVCSWLPLYHDMGLVGAELFSLCHDYPLVLMSPFDFLKRPIRWPKAISEYRSTLSPSPNFGFDYCAQLVTQEQAAQLDLTSWRVAPNGAEPIRMSTLERFSRRFAVAGFRPETFCPCYGLAEATLAVTFARPSSPQTYAVIDRASIGMNQAVTVLRTGAITGSEAVDATADEGLVTFSVGRPVPGLQVLLSDDQGRLITGERQCGEIVVRGSSVARGYVTGQAEPMVAFTDNTVSTGDLGFLLDGELYVLERLKNMIIHNGQNYLANALEYQLAQQLEIDENRIAIFERDLFSSQSEIVAVIETESASAANTLRQRLSASPGLELPIARVLFTKQRAIPRTTSGKKRHFVCRQLLALGQLSVILEINVGEGGGHP